MRWVLDGSIKASQGQVNLVTSSHIAPRNGQEVCIQYSDDAPNFTMLLQYGFVDEMNDNDCVRIHYPCNSPALQNDSMQDRLALLQVWIRSTLRSLTFL